MLVHYMIILNHKGIRWLSAYNPARVTTLITFCKHVLCMVCANVPYYSQGDTKCFIYYRIILCFFWQSKGSWWYYTYAAETCHLWDKALDHMTHVTKMPHQAYSMPSFIHGWGFLRWAGFCRYKRMSVDKVSQGVIDQGSPPIQTWQDLI